MFLKPNSIGQTAAAILAAALISAPLAQADSVSWTGTTGLWSDATWSLHPPDGNNGDQAFVDSGAITIKDGITATAGALVVRNGAALNVTGGSLTLQGPAYSLVYLAIGDFFDGPGTMTMTGGSIDARDGKISVGYDVNSQGTATVSGGTITHSSEFWVGQSTGASGKLTVSGSAQITGTTWFGVGREGGTGELIVTDNALIDKSNGGNFKIAGDNDSVGTVTVQGTGQFICENGVMEIASGGNTTGTLTIKESGSVAVPGYWSLMGGTGNTATLNLNGGSLKTNWIGKNGGTTTINFNGGTLIAQENGTSYFSAFDPADLHVLAGGFKFDSNGFDVTIVQGLSGAGSLTKLGNGDLQIVGANGYTGDTTVSGGTLTLGSPSAFSDTSTITLATMGSLILNGKGTDVVNKLIIGGVTQAAGLYTFGTGQIQVTTGGTADAFQTWAASKGLDGTQGKENGPTDDPDKDGVPNLLEFALNGNPLSAADGGRIYAMTADSDYASDPSTAKELILTIAVRTGTPAFTGSSSVTAAMDGITYTVEGSQALSTFTTAVHPVSPITTGLPAAGTGYEYRSFSLDGSDGLAGKGFLRLRVTK